MNKVDANRLEVCLIPETIKRTNLKNLNIGEKVTFEVDAMARAFVHLWKLEKNHV
ncbi:MAG: hypothetical protein KDD40_04765 [Bdellovibrionales bacterium]|nr:hypothetical protein [Bdellovibrionales bacterium]